MWNPLDNILDLSFHSQTPPDLKEIFRFLNCSKEKLYIYRMGIETNLFLPETIAHLTQLMTGIVGRESNLNPYALYVVWGSALFLFNLSKKGSAITLTAPSHLYIEPKKRPLFLNFVHEELIFKELTEFSPRIRDALSLSHVNEAFTYNEAIKKLVDKLQVIETYLQNHYDYSPYFLGKPVQDFLYGLSSTYSPRTSPRKPSKSPIPFPEVTAPAIREVEYHLNPYLKEIFKLDEIELFQQVTPVSPHILFRHFSEVEQQAMRIYQFIQDRYIYDDLISMFSRESRKYLLPPKHDLSHQYHDPNVPPYPEIAELFEPQGLRVITEFSEDETHISDIEELVIKILKKFSLEDLFRLIKSYNYEECEDLFKLCKHFSGDSLSLFKGLMYQHQLNILLERFGIENQFTPATNRLILTSHDVRSGLILIEQICIENNLDYSNLEFLRGLDIRALKIPEGENIAKAEIAWGTLDVLLRKNPRPFISCSKELLQRHIKQLKVPATLILDGHGGTSDVRIAEGSYPVAKMNTLTQDFLRADKAGHIQHIILQSCVSGRLKPIEVPYYLKNIDKESGKQRMLIIDTPVTETVKNTSLTVSRDYFVKTSSICLAQSVINAIFMEHKQLLIAFTFSPFLINPSFILGMGNVGISPEAPAQGESYAEWGTDIPPERRNLKSVSVIWNPEHRKCKDVEERYSPISVRA